MVENITDTKELNNRHRVKAILSVNNNLIFLSRECIPSTFFDINKLTTFYRLTCITAYRGTFLQDYCQLSRTPIELIEGCTDSTAENYQETANTDDGSCIYPILI